MHHYPLIAICMLPLFPNLPSTSDTALCKSDQRLLPASVFLLFKNVSIILLIPSQSCQRLTGAQRINPHDCRNAVDMHWPDGRTPIRYFLSDPRPSNADSIPSYNYLGSCRVALESAGPHENLPPSILLRPHELRGFAGYLIQRCAAENNGNSGFLTFGLSSALSFIHDSGSNNSFGGNFLTISISPRAHQDATVYEPGSHNPNIAAILAEHVAGLGRAVGYWGKKVRFSYFSIFKVVLVFYRLYLVMRMSREYDQSKEGPRGNDRDRGDQSGWLQTTHSDSHSFYTDSVEISSAFSIAKMLFRKET